MLGMYIYVMIFENLYTICHILLQLIAMPDDTLIDHVACGSAHSVAWSSVRRKVICILPKAVPLEFNYLQNLSLYMLKNRLVLLHHFSNVFCKSLPLFNLSQLRISSDSVECDLDLDCLRCIIFLSAKVKPLLEAL